MSSLPLLGAPDKKKPKLTVYTIEECGSCHLKTKHGFKEGDFVHKREGQCHSCKGNLMITMIYAEAVKVS